MLKSKLISYYLTQVVIIIIATFSYFFILQSLYLLIVIAFNFILWLFSFPESNNITINYEAETLDVTNRLKKSMSKSINLKTISFFRFEYYKSFRHPIQEVTISIFNNPSISIKLSGIKQFEVSDFIDKLNKLGIKSEYIEK